jgi:hypothetical protein
LTYIFTVSSKVMPDRLKLHQRVNPPFTCAERFRYSLGSRPGVWKPSAIFSKLNRSIRSRILGT